MEEEDEDGEIFEAQRFIDYAEIEHDAKTQEAINVLAALHDELYASGDVRLQAYVSRQKKQMFLTRRRGAPVVAHFAPEADTGTETILGIVKAKADNNMGKLKNPCVRLFYWFLTCGRAVGLSKSMGTFRRRANRRKREFDCM
jgi:hypothetical protein